MICLPQHVRLQWLPPDRSMLLLPQSYNFKTKIKERKRKSSTSILKMSPQSPPPPAGVVVVVGTFVGGAVFVVVLGVVLVVVLFVVVSWPPGRRVPHIISWGSYTWTADRMLNTIKVSADQVRWGASEFNLIGVVRESLLVVFSVPGSQWKPLLLGQSLHPN